MQRPYLTIAAVCLLGAAVAPFCYAAPAASTATPALPAPASIVSRFKAASGGAAWDSVRTLHTVSSIKTSGLSGTDEQWHDALTGRGEEKTDLGPTTEITGYDGTHNWDQQDASAAHYEDGVEDQQEANDTVYLASLAFWYPQRHAGQQTGSDGVVCDVLTVTPQGGHPLRMWFARATGLLVRTVDRQALQTQTTTLGDYRAVPVPSESGSVPTTTVMQPFTTRLSTGDAGYDTFEQAASVEINAPAPAHEFDLPPAPAADYAFANGADSVTVPLSYSRSLIHLPIKIDGKPFQAILDSGGQFIVDPSLAKTLGLKPQGAQEGTGIGSSGVVYGHVRVSSVQIGSLTLQNPMFLSIPLPGGLQNSPIVGYELLQRFVVSLDFDKSAITFTRPDRFHYPRQARLTPFHFNGQIPEIEGSVDGVSGVFTIDVGDGGSLTLNGPFVAAHQLIAKYKPKFTVLDGYGAGGPEYAAKVRVETLHLGGATARSIVTGLVNDAAGGGSDIVVAGNVGMGVLHRFNLIFNYSNQTIAFIPNRHYNDPDIYTRSGILFTGNPDKAVVLRALPGSPAEEAGLKPGDLILSINGQAIASKAAATAFRTTMRTSPIGTRVTLKVLPKGKSAAHMVSLVLRDAV